MSKDYNEAARMVADVSGKYPKEDRKAAAAYIYESDRDAAKSGKAYVANNGGYELREVGSPKVDLQREYLRKMDDKVKLDNGKTLRETHAERLGLKSPK